LHKVQTVGRRAGDRVFPFNRSVVSWPVPKRRPRASNGNANGTDHLNAERVGEVSHPERAA